MTRLHLKLTAPIVLLFLALSLVARAMGSTQPPNPALRGFIEGCEDKPQPCWYGIIIEKTPIDEAIKILESHGWAVKKFGTETEIGFSTDLIEPFNCMVQTPYPTNRTNSIVERLWLNCDHITTGDALAVLGTPDTIGSCDYDYSGDAPTIIYRQQIRLILRYSSPKNRFHWLSPFNEISIEMTRRYDSRENNEWHGFVTGWRYQQLEPKALGGLCG
jgi:hypothetical protein